jgi:cyclophilin family peptidyl-prolyl cis-trans isomerase
MKPLSSAALAGICLVAGFSAAQAEDLTPPVIKNPIADIVVHAGAAPRNINLQQTFGLKNVTQEVVRFTTTLGPIDVELFPATAPNTVANFLGYVNRGSGPNGGYNGSLIQRSIVSFIIQGGSYYIDNNNLNEIVPTAAIKSEAGIPNTEGTIAVALSPAGPDSGTDAWFFNLADNTKLNDTSDGGPFTVFGRAIENGLDTINAIAALTTYDLSSELESDAFMNVPLMQYNPSKGLVATDFVYTNKIALIPVLPVNPGVAGLLTVKVLQNTHPDIVTAKISGQKLRLTFPGEATGMTKITLVAVDAANEKVKTSFTVKVQP